MPPEPRTTVSIEELLISLAEKQLRIEQLERYATALEEQIGALVAGQADAEPDTSPADPSADDPA